MQIKAYWYVFLTVNLSAPKLPKSNTTSWKKSSLLHTNAITTKWKDQDKAQTLPHSGQIH